ncbi:diguanylate phosphodiesterase [Acidimicrobium ferrooxidans DSM 10331]|uniref:Diguanylate phosphodiesterase n=1 Tax=Acidimicrobium ferrooxidans (strain DSM 10331 / JCM 15462 / NBRC 103882 / ICP) TaxID=525909 RepID=C7M018_ACIFD|nr:EAL domain-containing protein [Acidimicrobium ferrooxidans]ACU54326.1 diguanylate phosphodiesterase [Acidimicrobium ferrooxidans DSM 10331]
MESEGIAVVTDPAELDPISVDPMSDELRATTCAAQVVRSGRGLTMVHQPIVGLDGGSVVGYEALARFEGVRATQAVFLHGQLLGIGADLEARVLERALAATRRLARGWRLHVNVAPSVIDAPCVRDVLLHARLDRVVIELTEHVPARDVAVLERSLADLRCAGALVAVDDAGSGFGGLDLLMGVRPDIVKLDARLVKGLAHHAGRAGVVTTLVETAHRLGARVIAEGVEDRLTLDACVRLGIDAAQGYWLARPAEGFPRVDPECIAGVVRSDRRVLFGAELAQRLAVARIVPARSPLLGTDLRVGVDGLGRAVWVADQDRAPLRAAEVDLVEGWDGVRRALDGGVEAVLVVDEWRHVLGVVLDDHDTGSDRR